MNIQDAHHYPEVGVPLFWLFGLAAEFGEAALDTTAKTLEFLGEVEKTQIDRPPPEWATENQVRLELHTLSLRDFSRGGDGIPVLVLPPYAGHTSTIADFHEGQSLVATLRDNGCARVCATDWRSATPQMRFYDIDNYLAEINVCVDELGGKVALVGLCQGGWCAAMYAARFPQKIGRLVLAGSPIDTDAGEGAIKEAAHTLPMRFYEGLVHAGGGLMKGAFMLEGFKNMHPATQYFDKFADLYEHIDDPSYVARFEHFERWYEYTINLPGSWYLQVIREIFKENQLATGRIRRPRPAAFAEEHHLPRLSARRRQRRHHPETAGVCRRKIARNAAHPDPQGNCRRRPYRLVHGAQGAPTQLGAYCRMVIGGATRVTGRREGVRFCCPGRIICPEQATRDHYL